MFIIGLTGGVGCGKSAVAAQFQRHRVPVIDADIITRELVTPGSPILSEISAVFDETILQSDGQLNRRALRQIVFARPEVRRRLEAILHPQVREEILARARALSAPYCLAVIPLLIESGMDDLVERVLIVDCEEAQQISRVRARDHCSEEDVRAIMATQTSRQVRLGAADDVICNDGDLSELDRDVERLHRQYLALAARRDGRA